jgi:hypothetical protein
MWEEARTYEAERALSRVVLQVFRQLAVCHPRAHESERRVAAEDTEKRHDVRVPDELPYNRLLPPDLRRVSMRHKDERKQRRRTRL